jgi:hypothetical protein
MIKLGSFQQTNPQEKTVRDFQAPLPLSVFYSRRSPNMLSLDSRNSTTKNIPRKVNQAPYHSK